MGLGEGADGWCLGGVEGGEGKGTETGVDWRDGTGGMGGAEVMGWKREGGGREGEREEFGRVCDG